MPALQAESASARWAQQFDGRVKLLASLAVVIGAATVPAGAWSELAAFAGLVAVIAVATGVRAGYLLSRVAIVAPLVIGLAAAVPFMSSRCLPVYHLGPVPLPHAGLVLLATAAAKSALAVSAVAVLAATTPVADLLVALERLRCPRLFVAVVGFTYRYLFVLAEEAGRMRRACESRAHRGRWLWQSPVIGRLVGTLFIRSYLRGERVYGAMLSRGHGLDSPAAVASADGESGAGRPADWLVLFLVIAAAVAIRIFA